MISKLMAIALAVGLATTAGRAKTVPPQRNDAKPMPDFSGMTLVDLKNGINTIDLDGDGVNDMVVSGYRANGNAHDYVTYTFYARETLPGGQTSQGPLWGLVPFFDLKGMPTEDYFRDIEGADCLLQDVAVLQRKSEPVTVIIAKREMGSSFVDTMPVTFEIFETVRDYDTGIGRPPVYFKEVQHIRAKHNYCDVDDAMGKELGINFPEDKSGKDR